MLGRSLGLSSVGPVSGLPWDLSKPGVRSRALEFAMRGRPHTRVCSPICTPFRTLRVLTDCKRDPASVARELEDCVAHIEFGIELCLPQMHGRYFLLEQPAEATFRSLPRMVDLLSRGSVCRVKFDMGRYGVQSAGKPVKKPTAVVSTSFELARRLQIRCGDKMLDVGPFRANIIQARDCCSICRRVRWFQGYGLLVSCFRLGMLCAARGRHGFITGIISHDHLDMPGICPKCNTCMSLLHDAVQHSDYSSI